MRFGYLLFLELLHVILLTSCVKAEAITPDGQPEEEEVRIVLEEPAKSIAIIGDSISSLKKSSPSDIEGYDGEKYAAYYPRGDVKQMDNMWWYKVAQSLDITPDHICNCSWSGSCVTGNSSSTETALAGCSTKRIMDLSIKGFDPDIVFCYISCNDWARNVPLGNWSVTKSLPTGGEISSLREAYALMISKIKKQFPDCLIVCLTNLEDPLRDRSPGWPSNNGRGVTTDEWNKNLSELATAFGCLTVDLQDCGINYDNAPSYTVDGGLHPNDAGMTLIANKVIEELATILNEDQQNND